MAPHWNQDRPRGDGLPDRAPLFDETPVRRTDEDARRAARQNEITAARADEPARDERRVPARFDRPGSPHTAAASATNADRHPAGEERERGAFAPPPPRRAVDPFDARPGREAAGGRLAPPGGREGVTDELRYEGPIRLDDDGSGGGGPEPPDAGDGGRTLLTAALVGGAVILVIGVALYLRDQPPATGSFAMLDEAPMTAEGYGDAWTDEGSVLGSDDAALDPSAEGTLAADAALVETAPLRRLPSVDEPTANATRLVPDAVEPVRREPPAVSRPEPEPARAQTPARRDPAPARAVPAPAAAVISKAAADVTEGLESMIRSGRFGEAATMAKERARFAPNGSYTLQVLFACQEATVASAFREANGDGLMLFPVERPGSSCYRLTWGVFPDRDAALAQAGRVPAHFRRSDAPLPVALERAAGL